MKALNFMIFCLWSILACGQTQNQIATTNIPAPFAWLARENYTIMYTCTINEGDIRNAPKGTVVRVKSDSFGNVYLPGAELICPKVYLRGGLLINAELYPKVSIPPKSRTMSPLGGSAPTKPYYYVYIIDDILRPRIIEDIIPDEHKRLHSQLNPIAIFLGTKLQKGIGGRTVYY